MLLPFLTLGVECEWGSAAGSGGSSGGEEAAVVGDVESSLLSTSVFAGMLVGALVSGLLSDRVGRRKTVLAMTALTGLFGLASALAPTFHALLLCRTLVGVGVGGSPAALALFAELLPRNERGRHLVQYMLYFSSGAVIEVLLAWATLNSLGWRALLLVSALPALVLTAVAARALPESPGWLLARGRRREAAAILRGAFDVNHPQLKLHARGINAAAVGAGAAASTCPMHNDHDADAQSLPLENEADEAWDGPLIPCTCLSTHQQQQSQQPPEVPLDGARASSRSSDPTAAAQPTMPPSPSPSPSFLVPSPPAALSLCSSSLRAGSEAHQQEGGFLGPMWLVLSPELRALSVRLSALFLLMAFVYYSLVLLSLSFVQDPLQHLRKQCTLRDEQYIQLLAANLAEFPVSAWELSPSLLHTPHCFLW